MFLLTIITIIAVIVLIANGKNFFSKDNLNTQGKATPTNSAGKSPSLEPETIIQATPVPTPWPTPEPMPEESTDPAVLKVSWEDPAIFMCHVLMI